MSTKKELWCIFYFHCFWVWYMDWVIFLDGFHEERVWPFCTWREGWREFCRAREDIHSFDNLILEVTSHHFCHTVFVRIHSRNATHTQGGGITRRWQSLSSFLEAACNGLPNGSHIQNMLTPSPSPSISHPIAAWAQRTDSGSIKQVPVSEGSSSGVS